jgi:Holliday junction resolvasome RuvABC DNA-binding subunit
VVRFALGCNIKTSGDRCGEPDYSATPENHHQDARRAIQEQVALVKHLENLGFDNQEIRSYV